EEPALAASRLGPPVDGLVAHADVAVEAGRVARAVAQRGERRSPAARMEPLARRRRPLRDRPLGKSHDGARAACSPTRHGFGYSSAGKPQDRKSTRLNSSHVANSYAVFCLKKKSCRTVVVRMYRWLRLGNMSNVL